MPGIGVGEAAALGIEDGIETGDEHVGRDVGKERLIDSLEHLPRWRGALGCKAQHPAGGGHDQSRWDALARGVSYYQTKLALRERMEVVEVSSHLSGWPLEGGDLPAF